MYSPSRTNSQIKTQLTVVKVTPDILKRIIT